MLEFCFLLQAGCGAHAAAPGISQPVTEINITSRVLRQGVKRFGINIGGENFYDSGQMLRNLVFRNPGFEAESWQSILRCKQATATTCTDENAYAVWPQDFLKDARFQFLTGPAAGLSGSIQSSSPSHFPDSGVAFGFAALSHAPSPGDFVLVRFFRPGDAEKGWWTNSMQSGATFTTEFQDLAPNSPGKQALRMHASGVGQSARLDSYFDTYPGRSFLQLKGRYTLAFRAKGIGGNNSLNVSMIRAGSRQEVLFPDRSIRLSNTWKDYTYDWIASEDGASIGPVDLSFTVSGADVLLDDVSLTAAAAAGNPTAFRDAVVDTLRDLRPGILRYMDAGPSTASTIDNMIAPPFARERAGYSTQSTEQEQIPLGLHEFLELCKAVQAEPWYSLPATTTPEEAEHLIEYLGGAPATPYGARRVALGQRVPWTDVFPVIHLEFGNELWNAVTFYGAAMADPVLYGKRAEQIFLRARKSPAFIPSKFDLVLGSFAVNAWWTGQELANSDGYDSVAVAPYLFNKLADVSSPEAIFGSMFAEPESIDSQPKGYMAQQAKAARGARHPATLAVYEVNLSTDQGDAPQSAVDAVVPSLGGGLTVMEHMLLMLRDLGITNQSTYALPGYSNKFRNPGEKAELTPLWGMVLDMGGPTNRRRPLFLAEQLANQVMLSTMLETKVTGADPVWKQGAGKNTEVAIDKAHELQIFAFGQGRSRSLIVFNLDRKNALPITFSGDRPSGLVRLSQLTAAHITDSNEQKETVHVTHAELPNFQPEQAYSLSPFSMTAFEWSAAP
jgi:hypothetical protein